MHATNRQNNHTFALPVARAGLPGGSTAADGAGILTTWRRRRAVRRAERQLLARCGDCMIRHHHTATARENCASCRERIARHAVRLASRGGAI